MFVSQKYIRKLIQLVEESEIESLEVSSWGRKVKINQRLHPPSNGHSQAPAMIQNQEMVSPVVMSAPQVASPSPPPTAASMSAEAATSYVEIKSPMVGTFYAAPSPEASPYVSLNEKITVGQVVCIVEAMKLMNEIESDVSGRVVRLCAENAQLVEFGQTLFLIDPKG
jgi:acetyl-CoA carboxylase biotin carboxyl carrier protein